ncbi:MAG: hypothetical protein U0Q07_05420 [Acidimicrobiales bacterium]
MTLPPGTPGTIVAGDISGGGTTTTTYCVPADSVSTGSVSSTPVSSTSNPADDVSAVVGLVILGSGLFFIVAVVAVLGFIVHALRKKPAVAMTAASAGFPGAPGPVPAPGAYPQQPPAPGAYPQPQAPPPSPGSFPQAPPPAPGSFPVTPPPSAPEPPVPPPPPPPAG